MIGGTFNPSQRILAGRFLTRMGDQAWDFAIPLVILKLFPDQIRIAALYYLLVRVAYVLLLPKSASFIDRMNRLKIAQLGIGAQAIGVIVSSFVLFLLHASLSTTFSFLSGIGLVLFFFLVLAGVIGQLGSACTDILIANDLVPSTIRHEGLGVFNSRLRQLDLLTEVVAPVLAGFVLLIEQPYFLTGYLLIAGWNLISFFPELWLLKSIFKGQPALLNKVNRIPEATKKSMLAKLTDGWKSFFQQPVAPITLAYSFLWLSVLSPHGVLLAGFLKDSWQIEESKIGLFRGLGALFGLLATVLFPIVIRRFGLLKGSKYFILGQAGVLTIGLFFFFSAGTTGQIGFLICLLISRVGLYGFSLGEMQIRQESIPTELRGEVNGFAQALTGIATLILYAAGALLPRTEDFGVLIVSSVIFVCLGALIYTFAARKREDSCNRPLGFLR